MKDQEIKRRQRKTIGAQYPPTSAERDPDVGESTKSPGIPEEERVRCPRCGIERHGWTGNEGKGFVLGSQRYCCEGCAKNIGCDCIAEAERHTSLNLAKNETDVVPPKPM